MTPRVWFKSISLENVRSFGRKETINFTKDGNAAQWNVILGDNGTGKTTVLKGLCYTINSEYGSGYYAQDYDTYISLSRGDETKIMIHSHLEGKLADSFEKDIASFSPRLVELSDGTIAPMGGTHLRTSAYDKKGRFKNLEPPLLFAYGATRRIGESAITNKQESRIKSLLVESSDLVNTEEWLIQSEFFALKDGNNYYKRLEIVKDILLKLFQEEVFEIKSKIVKINGSEVPRVYFKTHYGEVLLHELNLGYKTLIAWMADLAKGLLEHYPNSENPLAESAICLVDEIDLHLHPKFQRTIIRFLTETFPNTQFIVTAHSPLIVQSAGDANIILLKRVGNEVHVENDPVDVRNWRLDQILTSELFGLDSDRSERVSQLRTERDGLLAKKRLAKPEKARLKELDSEIGFVPSGRDAAEIKAETIIQQLAEALRKQQQG
ncbi:AAA family ATPase [Larkinella sp. GY13]|uniref:AAA family ATPase n=1 Tax=Larkinella sp. GY13 TaxID=3453720 RepID=UPI003EEC091F